MYLYGYDETFLHHIIKQRKKEGNNVSDMEGTYQDTPSIAVGSWFKPKLHIVFRKAVYKAVFKSGANLITILYSKNTKKLFKDRHSFCVRGLY